METIKDCYSCKNTTWIRCYMITSTIKCQNCRICNNKKYIRCYVCEKGKELLLLDNKKYFELTYEMFY
jgi:hypothetical protein